MDFLLVLKEGKGLGQEFFLRFGVLYDKSCILADKSHRIMGLMVFGNIWRRHEDGRFMGCAEFGNSACSGAGYHYIGHRIGEVHPANEVAVVDVAQVFARSCCSLHEFIHALLVILPALPDDFYVFSSGAACVNPGLHSFVEGAAAKAASYNKDMVFAGAELIVLQAFAYHFFVCGNNVGADGITRHHDFVGGEEPFHSFVGYADASGFLAEQFIC